MELFIELCKIGAFILVAVILKGVSNQATKTEKQADRLEKEVKDVRAVLGELFSEINALKGKLESMRTK